MKRTQGDLVRRAAAMKGPDNSAFPEHLIEGASSTRYASGRRAEQPTAEKSVVVAGRHSSRAMQPSGKRPQEVQGGAVPLSSGAISSQSRRRR